MITTDEYYMKIALTEAMRAYAKGEVPVGAVLVKNGEVIASSHNMKEEEKDAAAHAEILAMRAAAQYEDNWRLTGCTLYVTKEPCIMCAGAIVHFRIERLVYGCADVRRGGVDSLYRILNDPRLNHKVITDRGILENECASVLVDFFRDRRQEACSRKDESCPGI